MACLDLSRIDNTGQIDPLVRLTQGGAKLIELRQLASAELDAQLARALDKRAHREFRSAVRPIRII